MNCHERNEHPTRHEVSILPAGASNWFPTLRPFDPGAFALQLGLLKLERCRDPAEIFLALPQS